MTRRVVYVLLSALMALVALPAASAGAQDVTTTSIPAISTDPTATTAPTAGTSPPTTTAAGIPDEAIGAPPPAPTGVTAEALDGGASLRWNATEAAPPVTTYVIRRDGDLVARVDADQVEFTERELLAEEPVSYTVAAVNDTGEGPESAAVSVVPTSDTTPGFNNAEAAPGPAEAQTERRVFTYSIATRGSISADVEQFSIHVAHTLNDPRGWSLGGSIEFRQVATGSDFTVWLAQASTVPSFSSTCSATWSCRVGRNVVINETRWRQATSSWWSSGGNLDSYQHYVVIHETGHWLGFSHAYCPGPGQAAPVMQQQSIGLNGCRHNGWPVPGERAGLSQRTGAPAWPIGPESDATVWGQPGDTVLACDWNGDGVDTQAIVRGGTWFVRDSLTGGEARTFSYGRTGDIPVCGDWNGDGVDGIGRVRGRRWFLRNSAGPGSSLTFLFGAAGGQPVTGDWDGRGGDGIGRVAQGEWKLRNTLGAGPVQWRLTYGRDGDQFVPGDWDGDGVDEPGVVRGATWFMPATWWPGSGGLVVRYGAGAAVSGRWDGLAVDKPGRFLDRLWAFRRYSPTP